MSIKKEIIDRLTTNDPTLTQLNLSYNNIGVEGARELSQSLLKNNTLTQLGIAWNRSELLGIAHDRSL